MGFFSFLGKIGKGIMTGIQKAAGFVSRIAPVVAKVAGVIPTPLTQGIAQVANLANGVSSAIQAPNPTVPDQAAAPPGTVPAPAPAAPVAAAPPGTVAPTQSAPVM